MKLLSLAISPCPNDTFIFDALVNGRLENSSFEFRTQFCDVQQLNELAASGRGPELIKVSCGALPQLLDKFFVLRSGGAMGYGNGPLLLSSQKIFEAECPVVLPGRQTTAALLFDFWLNKTSIRPVQKEYSIFDRIYHDLLIGKISQGVAIHECRFTWKRDGLHLLKDLGAFWEENTGAPVPLGCILCRKDLGSDTALELEKIIRRSVEYAWENPEKSRDFVEEHADISDATVTAAHIRTYVNNFSLDMGKEGERALFFLLKGKNIDFQHIFPMQNP